MAKQTDEIDIKVVRDNLAGEFMYAMNEAMFKLSKPRKYKDKRNKLQKFRDWINAEIYSLRHRLGEWIAGDYFDY